MFGKIIFQCTFRWVSVIPQCFVCDHIRKEKNIDISAEAGNFFQPGRSAGLGFISKRNLFLMNFTMLNQQNLRFCELFQILW